MYGAVGSLMTDILYGIFNLDLSPRKHLLNVAREALKKSGLKMTRLIRIGYEAVRAL